LFGRLNRKLKVSTVRKITLYSKCGRRKMHGFAKNHLTASTIKKAHQLSLSGNYKKSWSLLKSIQKTEPGNKEVLFMMAQCALSAGDNRSCLNIIKKLLKIDPKLEAALLIQGVANHRCANFVQAVDDFTKALFFNAHNVDALVFRALAKIELKQKVQALRDLETAIHIRPKYHVALINRALLLSDIGRGQEALEIINSCVMDDPYNIEMLVARGTILSTFGEHHAALSDFEKVLTRDDSHLEATFKRGEVLERLGRYDDAKAQLDLALSRQPRNIKILCARGLSLKGLGRLDAAIKDFDKVIQIDPENTSAKLNRGIIYRQLGLFNKALDDFNSLLMLEPSNVDALNNRAVTYKNLHEFSAALADLETAMKVEPNNADVRWNKALLLLLRGDFSNGWQYYEARWDLAPPNNWHRFVETDLPIWNGEVNKRLLIWPEQGIGDELLFSSMFFDLVQYSNDVTVICDSRLIPVFERSFGSTITFVSSVKSIDFNSYDCQIPIGSLGQFLRSDRHSFPQDRIGFLKPNPEYREIFAKRLQAQGRKVIGISWKSSNSTPEKSKSIHVQDLLASLQEENTIFVNLQYGKIDDEIAKLSDDNLMVFEDLDKKNEIEKLFALISLCQRVVTVSNVTAHIAGSLGVDTTVLVNTGVIWCWHEQGQRSAWYPSCRILRYDGLTGWNKALKEMHASCSKALK